MSRRGSFPGRKRGSGHAVGYDKFKAPEGGFKNECKHKEDTDSTTHYISTVWPAAKATPCAINCECGVVKILFIENVVHIKRPDGRHGVSVHIEGRQP